MSHDRKRSILQVIIVILLLTGCGCVPSILEGKANVIRAIERRDLQELGELALNEASLEVRLSAIDGLKEFPNNAIAVDYLSDVISNTFNPTVKRAALKVFIHQLKIDIARKMVTDHLSRGTMPAKMAIIDGLLEARSVDNYTKCQFLEMALQDQNADIRLAAAASLRKLGSFSGSSQVVELLSSPYAPIRRRAIEEFRNHYKPEYRKVLIPLASHDSDNFVRSYAKLLLEENEPGDSKTPVAQLEREAAEDRPKSIVNLQPQTNELLERLAQVPPAKINGKKYLFAIGIENYSDLASVPFASRSIDTTVKVMQNALGISSLNTVVLKESNATGTKIKARLKSFLNELTDNGVVYVYYIGHGVPAKDGKKVYLLPQDGSTAFYEDDFFDLNNFLRHFDSQKIDHVFAFFDACFSGMLDPSTLIFKGVAPAMVVSAVEKKELGHKVTLFSAAKDNQFANSYEEKKQRLFSYYFSRALIEQGPDVTTIMAFVEENVSKKSRKKGEAYSQDVVVKGNKNKIL